MVSLGEWEVMTGKGIWWSFWNAGNVPFLDLGVVQMDVDFIKIHQARHL